MTKSKFILPVLIGLFMVGNAEAKFYEGYRNECWVDTKGNDEYWFCGAQTQSCRGNKAWKKNTKHPLYHHESFTHNNRTFWCCNGTLSDEGKFVENPTWEVRTTVVKQLTSGKCTYEVVKDVCGNTISDVECTVPDTCPTGTIKRNNACIEPCSNVQAFESATSNKCVACETTKYQGISANNICVKCDSGTQFWDSKNKRCAAKETYTKYSASLMQKCFACPDDNYFKSCVGILGRDASADAKRTKNEQTILDKCLVKN